MKTLLIALIFTIGSISTAFAGGNGHDCSKQSPKSQSQIEDDRRVANIVNSSTRPASGQTGTSIDSVRNGN